MSDGNRGDRRSNWLAWATGGILILLAATGGIYGITQQIGYQKAAEDHAQEYARYAREKAEQPCRVLPPLKLPECLANAQREQENDAREKRREYADLVAQQKSALWTNIMGLAAITGMILSVIGVWLIYATFRETKRTADEAKRSADAFIAAERGWLKSNVEIFGVLDNPTVIKMVFRASVKGKSGIEIANMHWGILRDKTFPRHFQWKREKPKFEAIEPNSKITNYPIFTLEVPRENCLLGGWIAYRTQFPGEGRAYFLIELSEAPDEKEGRIAFAVNLLERPDWPTDT
jgi:hypothetical protein